MNKYAFIAILCIFLTSALSSSAQHFVKFYSSTDAVIYSAIPLSNGDILALGSANRPNQKQSAVAMRLSGAGLQKWAYRRNDTTYSHFLTAAERPGGQGYVLGGWCELVPFQETSMGLAALMDTNGTISNIHGMGGFNRVTEVRIMGNGNLHFGGGSAGFVWTNPPTFMRTNSNLGLLYTARPEAALSQETSGNIDPTPDGWVTTANSRSMQSGPFEMAFGRHSPTGAGSFNRYFNCGTNGSGKAVRQLASGNHLYLGATTLNAAQENVLLRLDPLGNVLAAKTFHRNGLSNSIPATSMRLTHPDSVIIWGSRSGSGWICRGDTTGNIVWMKDYALPSNAVAIEDVRMFPNGDLLIAATTSTGSLLMRVGASGSVTCGASPGLGTAAAFTTGTTSATATTWFFGTATINFDSLIHPNTVPVQPPSDLCTPPCSNSIVVWGNPCPGYSNYVCGASPLATTTNWTLNGVPAGTTNCITVNHNALGSTDTLALTSVINGCTTTTTTIVPLGAPIVPSFTFTTSGLTASFTNTSTQPSYVVTWFFGDGSSSTANNPTHTYAVGGTYNVSLQVMGPCGQQTFNQQVTIVCPLPTVSFSATATGPTLNFNSTVTSGTPVTYAWTFGDGGTSTLANPSHTYATTGPRTVCLTATNSCGSVQACSTVVVTCPPPTVTIGASGNLLSWAFTSNVTSGTPVTYLWNFGDGNTSTQANPSHAYSNPGTYNVCLSVNNGCSTVVTCTTINVICPLPTVSFTGSGTNLNWSFTSTVSSTTPFTYSWDFGDGGTSNLQNPTHTYTLPFGYNVCLTVANACGMTTACSTFTVTCPAPSAQFTSSGTAYTQNFIAANVQGNPTSYTWDFGDGNGSSLMNPSHTYATSGTYNVCLTVSNICGSTTWCNTVPIICPIPASTFTTSHTGLVWDFLATPTGGYPVTYVWDFGDGGSSTNANPTHTYASTGTYTICLTATSICGTSQTCVVTAVFAPPPVVTFYASGYRYAWNFTSNVTGAGPFTYLWNFGNGTTSTSPNPSMTFTTPGTYTVCLTVMDAFGTSTTTCMTITVVCPMPTCSFTYSQQGQTWTFLSQASGTAGITYMWDFGDGATSTVHSPTHAYATSGLYNVCLTVQDSCGMDTTCHMVQYTAVGLEEHLQHGIRIWPVPAKGSFQMEGEFEGTLSIYDCNGRCLWRQELQLNGGLPASFDVNTWAKAIYLLRFETRDGRQWTMKLPVD